MDLFQLIIILMIVGLFLWAVNTYIPMDPKIKNIMNIAVVIAVVLWLFKVFGLFSIVSGINVGSG